MHAWRPILPAPSHAVTLCSTYKPSSARSRAKMAGRSPNTLNKPVPMACNGCSRAPSGMKKGCAMNCAPSSGRCSARLPCPASVLSRRRPSPWGSWMKVAFPSAATTPLVSSPSIAARAGASKTARSASSLLISGIRKIPTYHLICGFDPRSFAVFKDSEGQFHILAYVTARGHTLIDRELYLPLDWLADQERCREAGVPESVRFQTKPELAIQMLSRLWAAQVPLAWVVADAVYGGNLDLRCWCEQHQYPYVMAVACTEPVGIVTADGQRRRVEVSEVEALVLHDQDWQRLSMSEGTKGPRLFDWACVPMLHRWEEDGRHWLLIRRSLSDPLQKAYYFVFGPQGTTLPEMVAAIGARWHIEEDFETAKEMGLDQYARPQLDR